MKDRLTNSRRICAALVVASMLLMLAPAALASTLEAGKRGNYRGQCRRLTLQIDHYQGTILPMAVSRGNRGWENATNDHLERLWHRRADLCPEYGAERAMLARAADRMRKFNAFIAMAGRAAASYFTGGLYGGLVP